MKLNADKLPSGPSRSLWSLSSSFARKQDAVGERDKSFIWDGEFLVKLSVYSLAVTSSTVYSFPEAIYRHGGILLIPYVVVMILLAQPLVYLELVLGQLYLRNAPVRSSERIFGVSKKGIQYAILTGMLLFLPNQSILSSFSNLLVDFGEATTKLPWCQCANASEKAASSGLLEGMGAININSGIVPVTCVDHLVLPPDLNIKTVNPFEALFGVFEIAPAAYWTDDILQMNSIPPLALTGLSFFNWKLFFSSLVSSVILFAVTVESRVRPFISMVLLFCPLVLIVALLVIFFKILKTTGRVEILLGLFEIDWEDVKDIQVWQEAIRLAIITTCLGLGLHTTVASSTRMSYKKYYEISWMFIVITIVTAVMCTTVSFSVVELFSMATGRESEGDAVPHIPGIVAVLFASVFCIINSSHVMKCLYGIFFLLKFLSFLRIQILAVETVHRTLEFYWAPSHTRKHLKILSAMISSILMHVTIIFPYFFPPTKGILENWTILTGCCPILILLLVQLCRLSKTAVLRTIKEDLYLSYKLCLPKIFELQLKSWILHIVVLMCTVTLSYELIVELWVQLDSQNWGNWQNLYALLLNFVPIGIFLVITCLQGVKLERKCPCAGGLTTKVRRFRKRRKKLKGADKTCSVQPHTEIHLTFPFPQNVVAFSPKLPATVDPKRLQNPRVEQIIDSHTSIHKHLPIRVTKDNDDHTSLEYLDLTDSASVQEKRTKRKPPKVRPPVRRPPVAVQWNLGGLGDYQLCHNRLLSDHHATEELGIDMMESEVKVDAMDKSLPYPLQANSLEFESNSLCLLDDPKTEIPHQCQSDISADFATRTRTLAEQHVCSVPVDLPPPPTFLLENDLSDGPLQDSPSKNSQNEQLQSTETMTESSEDNLEVLVDVSTEKSHVILEEDVVPPKVARQRNASFGSDSEGNSEFASSALVHSHNGIGSAPSLSLLYADETVL